MNYARQSFLSRLRREVLLLDGAMGTMLQEAGLPPGEAPEAFLLARPEVTRDIHRAYVDAGSDIIITATFGASPLRLADHGLADRAREINRLAMRVAHEATAPGTLVAAGLGPCGRLITPLGEASFAEVRRNYETQVEALVSMDPDLFIVETIFELREMKAIIQAIRRHYDGPVIAQFTFQEDGRTFYGTDALTALTVVESLDVDVVGANCSVGPAQLLELFREMGEYAVKPLSVEPNAGLPRREGDVTTYPGEPEDLMECVPGFVSCGVAVIGGCCGTNEKYIASIRPVVKAMQPGRPDPRPVTRLASGTATVLFGPGQPFRIIGERINPTGRKEFKRELREKSMATVRREAADQAGSGADVLDVNVGVGGGDPSLEAELMRQAVRTVQEVTPLPPLAIDSADPEALEAGLSEAPGKCLLNSITGEQEKLDRLFPLARKWGAAVLGLLIDEKGVPRTTADRMRIAEKIVAACDRAGIPRRDLFIDCVTLPVSAAPDQAAAALRALRQIRRRYRVRTVLGLSNVSFGLPRRPLVNHSFLAMAMSHGLDCALVNPLDRGMVETAAAANVLLERDPRFGAWIDLFGAAPTGGKAVAREAEPGRRASLGELIHQAVLEGDREVIGNLVQRALEEGIEPMRINTDFLVPGLEEVGRRFNQKVLFLPQVILAAETVQTGFGLLRPLLSRGESPHRGKVIMATVKGDVHDIGKNILGAVLENHGYRVIDLGKNVDRERIIARALEEDADLVALSALMTTTMVEMKQVIALARKQKVPADFLVGGAVVSREFADEIGAAGYGRDAMAGLAAADELMARRNADGKGQNGVA